MFGKRFGVVHGWVEGIQANSDRDKCLLKIRLGCAQTIMLTMFKPDWPLAVGNEISIAVNNSNPSHAVALVDHTAGDGAILPCPECWLDWEDAAIAAALLVLTLFMSGWGGMPVYGLLLAFFGMAKYWLPEAIRRRDADRISFLIDQDYRSWREARDG